MLDNVNSLFARNLTLAPTYSINYHHGFALPFERSIDPKDVTWFFQKHWHFTVYLGIVYLIACKWSQCWMKNRKPYDLRAPMTVWNGVLAVFSIAGYVLYIPCLLYI